MSPTSSPTRASPYAAAYADFVAKVRRIEAERVPGSTALSEAVAHHLYKLMAYKDEYEVARLSVAADMLDAVAAQYGPDAKVAHRLHPPVLRALGMRSKISLGPWFKPVFRLLVALRNVRGTPFDPFGHSKVRKVERELITEYREVIDESLTALRPESAEVVVRMATLPDLIRGYEAIKLENVAKYRHELTNVRSELDRTRVPEGGEP